MIAFPAAIDAPAIDAPTIGVPTLGGPTLGGPTLGVPTVEASTPGPATAHTAGLDAADTESLGDEIARLAAHLHAATYHLLVLIRDFDEREGWGSGFLSCAHWLSWRTGISPGPAREKVRVARALASLPRISSAMARGEISYSKVRALTRVAKRENEAELLEVARHATAVHVERLIRGWRRVDRLQEAEEEERRQESRYLRLYPDQDGTFVLRGRLDPEVGALLEKALEWAGEALYRNEKGVEGTAARTETEAASAPTFSQRQADALGLVAERALASGERALADAGRTLADAGREIGGKAYPNPAATTGRADRFQVVVHVEASKLREVSESREAGPEGTSPPLPWPLGVPAGTSPFARRLACDAGVVVLTRDAGGRVLDVGRRRRTVPPAIRRALEFRDRGGCRFPGCGCRFTDAHHIRHWADGGETKLDNLVLLCRRHHRMVHEGGFRVEMTESGEDGGEDGGKSAVRFVCPDGRVIWPVPETPHLPADPVHELMGENADRGMVPDEWTATPLWNGDSLDYGLAIDMLRGLKDAPVGT